jgi:hypothetical protein
VCAQTSSVVASDPAHHLLGTKCLLHLSCTLNTMRVSSGYCKDDVVLEDLVNVRNLLQHTRFMVYTPISSTRMSSRA